MKKSRRIYAAVTLIFIIIYGILKIHVCRIYSILVAYSITFFGFDPIQVLDQLNNFSTGNKFNDHYLGWPIYYPTYLMLHLIFIHLLFFEQKMLKKRLSVGLITVIGTLLLLIFLGKWLDLTFVYKTSYSLFQHLFGLPFILLSIEGGRVLYSDIDRKLSSYRPIF